MGKHTPFFDFHVNNGARMVDFAGWDMPIMYRSIVDEHNQTRNSGSIFDVSHMGRLQISGKEAEKFLNRVFTRDVTQQKLGQCRYGLLCNESGGILDDVILSKDKKNWLMVVNAG
ncbi:MAG: glycine cleavage system aminomethyltransferase GcvT, partial [Tepidisphaeraceae bacterium]